MRSTHAAIHTDRETHLRLEEPKANYIGLNQAARLWGKNPGTLSRHAKEGKFQWHDVPGSGKPMLLLSQLAAFYGAPSSGGETAERASSSAQLCPVCQAKDALIETLKDQLAREREIADQWREQLERVSVRALPPRRWWWQREYKRS